MPLTDSEIAHKITTIKILEHPNKILSTPCEPVDFEKDTKEKLQGICEDMDVMLQSTTHGERLGLAAPQIGVNKRLFIMFGLVVINPEWRPMRYQIVMMNEGCYSCPGKVYRVQRFKYGWASWYNIDGERHEVKLKGMEAIVFQHEFDHINGKCCPDVGTEIVSQPGRTDEQKDNSNLK